MRPVAASDFNPFGGIVFVDWMRLSPYRDAGHLRLPRLRRHRRRELEQHSVDRRSTPAGTSLAISVRTGNALDIDGSVLGDLDACRRVRVRSRIWPAATSSTAPR